jgi:hypothetical protein
MGAVYKYVWGKQRGRYIYNRNRLHKVGFMPKHKQKHIIKMKEMKKEIEEFWLIKN